MYARRVSLPAVPHLLALPALLALVLPLLVGVYAPPARAGVDLELIGETLSQEGYYVDSGSRYLRSDAALDRLRSQLEAGTGQPVYVTVLPAGAAGPGLAPQLARQVGRKGTYAVLVGNRMEAFSTSLPASVVNPLVSRASAAHRGNPEAALVELARLLNQRTSTRKNTGKSREKTSRPRATPTETETADTGVAEQPAPPPEGPNLALIGGLAALAVAIGGGFFWWWRRRAAAQAVPAGQGTGQGFGMGSGYEQGFGATPAGPPAGPQPGMPPGVPPGTVSAAGSPGGEGPPAQQPGLPPHGQPPHGQPPHGQPPQSQPPHGQPPQSQPPQPPRHPRSDDSGGAPGSFGGAPGSFGGEPPQGS